MGRVFMAISALGVVILAIIVILAIVALTGHFEHELTNPPS
jgi:hypothetical protein